jgi:TPR repeat protein
MTGRHTRLIVLTVLATMVLSAPTFSHQDSRPLTEQQIADLRAYAEDDVETQFHLGVSYANGLRVPKDDVEATRWFRMAAEQGNMFAQNALGAHYAAGIGVSEDDAEAVQWWLLAAEQGLALAEFNLGLKYDSGEGVPQDHAEAARWFRLAAEQGHLGAQEFLGAKYWIGMGVVQDYVQSHMWLHLAASRLTGEDREKAVEAGDSVALLMTPAQIAEAQRLAREWETAHPREP